ncbi:flavin-dependent oxidoreductase [Alphaproteobacteria bacterium]|jgi:5-methylphenazine-1-carboxylate 1-monooxygenase|nr:flavin-dependent oxidoreductase [Alphaproteobacteria bacterium]
MTVLIAGGGIGGLTTALMLHQRGIDCEIYERSTKVRELGVGINTLPHAIKELAELGLLDALDAVGIRTQELIYQNRVGQEIWQEPRGTYSGLEYPQFSIHRGKLQRVLHEAVIERLGEEAVHVGHELIGFDQTKSNVTIQLIDRLSGSEKEVRGKALIACDGIHSVIRKAFHPSEGPPVWNGIMLWRGATEWEPFLTGDSMVIAGGMEAKLVLYPISREVSDPTKVLMNWAVGAKVGDGKSPPPRREDWNRKGRLKELLPFVQDKFSLDVLDPLALIEGTDDFYEYPMCDRDPLKKWSHERVTLLGDAAHPMYPVGSNGASQAILDARCLADSLASGETVVGALEAYEAERLPVTSQIVRTNRSGGPERVIDVVNQRAPDGFDKLHDVASAEELEDIVKGYSQLAGFDKKGVNKKT